MENYLVILTEQLESHYGEVISRKALPAKLFMAFDRNHAAFRCGSLLERTQTGNTIEKSPLFDKYSANTDYVSMLEEAFSKSDTTGVTTYSVKIIHNHSRTYYLASNQYADPPILITAELAPWCRAKAHSHGLSACVWSLVANELQTGLAHAIDKLDTAYAISNGEHLIDDSMSTHIRWDAIYGFIRTCKSLAEVVEYVTQLIPAAYNGPDTEKRKRSSQLILTVYLRTSADGRYTALPDDLRLDVFDAFRTRAQVEADAQENGQALTTKRATPQI